MKSRWMSLLVMSMCYGPLLALAQDEGSYDHAFVPVPKRFESAYLEKRPDRFLVDPQSLLQRSDIRDQLEFLEYHSSDSSIDVYLYLLKGDQAFADKVNVESSVERQFATGKPAVVVHYFLGHPERAAMYLSPKLNEVVSLAEQGRALETSVAQAAQDVLPAKQLEKFLIQMSIRIYSMERLLQRETALNGGDVRVELVPKIESGDPDLMSPRERLLQLLPRYGVPAGGVALLCLFLLWLRMRFKRRAQYRFPDLGIEERLEGSHGAGIGAVITFASASERPASQRD